MLKYFKKNKGFTLIELLVVIAIIAILASIVLVSLNTARVKGRDARRIADIKSIQIALELHFDSKGRYPGATDTTEDTSAEALQMLVSGGFIPAIPKDPSSGTAYRYAWESDTTIALGGATKYHLSAILEQKGHSVAGTDADKVTAFATGGDDIAGETADCLTGGTGATGVNEVCYDVIP